MGKEIVGRKRRERKMGKSEREKGEEIQKNWVFYTVRRKYDMSLKLPASQIFSSMAIHKKIITKIKFVLTLIY